MSSTDSVVWVITASRFGVARDERPRVLDRLDQMHGAFRQLAGGADHLGMAGMPDQQDFAPLAELALGLDMHLGDERAGGIEKEQIPRPRRLGHRFRHAMGREHDGRAGIRDFVQFLDEDGALGLEALDHIAVMDDFMAHIDGRAVFGERKLDDLDGAVDAGAEAARARRDRW